MNTLDYLNIVCNKTIREKYTSRGMEYAACTWGQGVALYALLRAYQITEEERYFNYVKDFCDYHINKGLPSANINTTIPFIAFLDIYKKTGQIHYKNLCEERANYLMASAKRADGGMFEHTVGGSHDYSQQIWADTLFMGALFLAKWGRFTGNIMYAKESARQLILHYKYLTDNKTGLIFHGYNCKDRNHMSAVKWGRANGWGIISCAEILDAIPDFMPEFEQITEIFNNHIESFIKYQDESGMFRTVMDSEASYMETTVTGCFYHAASYGGRYLIGDCSKETKKALEALLKNIDKDGTALYTSAGTPVLDNEKEYNDIGFSMTFYGQGLMILALSSALTE
jgi:unsaturated rhamnogalacturonyl hydrolase